MDTINDRLVIAGREFKSRLWVGTGKYKDFVETKKAIEASGADVVTVQGKSPGLSRSEKIHHFAEHRRLLHGGRCRPVCPVGSRGRRVRSGQAGSPG